MTAGSSYAFGIFSNKIKASAGFSQSDMTTITTVGSLLGSFTFPAGVLFDFAGPQYVLGVATALSCLGFIMLALIFQDVISPSVYSVAAANGLTNWGAGFTDCGSLMTNLFNLPISRGEIMIIQKTFFGLGSTFLSLCFDGFFGATDNYIGYAAFVCVLIFVTGSLGAAVTRLPKYKRTTRDLKRIAGLGPVEREQERLVEERTFELFHNPRLVDRRRLNAGVLCLFVTLVFFSLFSIIKAYVSIASGVLTGLTVLACLCLLSFFVMVAPFDLPAFFDFAFLPDLHPPEELEDKPSGKGASGPQRSAFVESNNDARTVVVMVDDNVQEETNDGRTSAFLPQRASIAGNSSPISIPQAVAPSTIPSISTGFGTNILQPIIWCFWVSGFAMFGANTVIIQNLSQIFTAANGGVYDKSLNSLIVALSGIGSACGRILIGFAEMYLHRRNAILREAQLVHQAQLGDGAGAASTVDMTPIYHRWDSSVVFLMPLCPATMVVCALLLVFCPVDAFPVLFFVCGVAMGGFLATFALGIREIFSVDVAKHYNFVSSAGMLSSVLLNRIMFGMWYDREVENHPAPDGVTCSSSACFSGPLYVLSGLNLMAIGSSFLIVYRWRNVRRTF
eukprot:GILI01015005.1.p1 GENE.GILI01015005.1~~GILI01015005.1.p1  ORF type:complete len:619 (+),score=124.20 GILI01015005.1:111-1967(+)